MDTAAHVDIRITQRFDAPAEHVFNAWIDPAIAGKWLFATASQPVTRVEIDARVGGSFCFVERGNGADIDHAGQYIDIVRPRRIGFTLSRRSRSLDHSRVRVEIIPLDIGCKLMLHHEGVLSQDASRIEGRWAGMLYGLATILKPKDEG
jgi:uncharacterized protein YndB with AHSA1/START domain